MLMVTTWYCFALPRSASPPAECREPPNLLQKSAKYGVGLSCRSSRPDRSPALPPVFHHHGKQTRSQRRGSRRSFALSPRDCHPAAPTVSGHCAQLIVAFEAVLHAPRAVLRPEFVTPAGFNNKTERDGRVAKPAGHGVQCSRRRRQRHKAVSRKNCHSCRAVNRRRRRRECFQRRRKTKRRPRNIVKHNHTAVAVVSFDRLS